MLSLMISLRAYALRTDIIVSTASAAAMAQIIAPTSFDVRRNMMSAIKTTTSGANDCAIFMNMSRLSFREKLKAKGRLLPFIENFEQKIIYISLIE